MILMIEFGICINKACTISVIVDIIIIIILLSHEHEYS